MSTDILTRTTATTPDNEAMIRGSYTPRSNDMRNALREIIGLCYRYESSEDAAYQLLADLKHELNNIQTSLDRGRY